MQFEQQQLSIAGQRGTVVRRPQLMCVHGLATALGGESGSDGTYNRHQVGSALLAAREALATGPRSWLPSPYHKLLTLAPEDAAIAESVLKVADGGESDSQAEPDDADGEQQSQLAWEVQPKEREALASIPDGEVVPVIDGLYTTPAPRTLPVGALTQLQQVQELQALRGMK
jgi:hypothetical protein